MNMMAAKRRRLVLVGNGMAGIRTLEEILRRAPHAFSIAVFGGAARQLRPHHAVPGPGG